jgi:ankyrin repeat protein
VRLIVERGKTDTVLGARIELESLCLCLWARDNGHHAIVKLLDKGANINNWVVEYGNALHATSYNGHEQVVKLLLDKGADVNAQGGQNSNALQAALYNGHEQVVELLLNKGADINAQGGQYGNVLQAASYNGQE